LHGCQVDLVIGGTVEMILFSGQPGPQGAWSRQQVNLVTGRARPRY
jgi:hypothetical protein